MENIALSSFEAKRNGKGTRHEVGRLHRLAPPERLGARESDPRLVRWVERFLRLSASRSREGWQDTLRVFLDVLGRGETPDWRIRLGGRRVIQSSRWFPGLRGECLMHPETRVGFGVLESDGDSTGLGYDQFVR